MLFGLPPLGRDGLSIVDKLPRSRVTVAWLQFEVSHCRNVPEVGVVKRGESSPPPILPRPGPCGFLIIAPRLSVRWRRGTGRGKKGEHL